METNNDERNKDSKGKQGVEDESGDPLGDQEMIAAPMPPSDSLASNEGPVDIPPVRQQPPE